MNRKYFLIAALFSIIFFSACREEIVEPNNPAANLNEPVQLFSNNSYTFLLNADNFNINLTGQTNLTGFRTNVYLNVTGYKAGNVVVYIYGKENRLIYTKALNYDEQEVSAQVVGEAASLVSLKFNEFSGKVKVELTRVQ